MNNDRKINGLIKFVSATELKDKSKRAKKIERQELQFTQEEAKMRAENMIKFLRLTHPGNTGEGFKKAIEIKFLLRGKGVSYNFYKPTLLFNLDDPKTLEVLTNALYKTSIFSNCCYYSLYNFDNKKDVRIKITDENGKPTYKHEPVKKIVDGNTFETWVLPMDLDNISREEYEEYRQDLLDLGIETMGKFTGNGYQMLILLEKPLKMKSLYRDFTTKMHKLIPAIDTNINVPTQVFRSPFTRNCKEYSDQFKYYKPYSPEPKEVTILNWTEKRYSKKEIFDILDAEIDRRFNKGVSVSSKKTVHEVPEETKDNAVQVISRRSEVITASKTYQDLYKHLNFDSMPSNIQNILKGTTEGLRNKCVLYLTPFLNKVLGLTQEQALETLEVFNELCTPVKSFATVKSDYYRFSEAYADYTKGIYEPVMAQEFGKEELDTLISKDIDKVFFDNEIIKKFNVIPHSSIRIYLAIKLLEITDEKESFTKEEIASAAGVSEKTVQRNIKDLTKFSIVLNVPGNTRKGIKKGYKINKFGQYTNGFTKLNTSLVEAMLLQLEPSEMVIYIYLTFKVNAMDVAFVFTSQAQMALDIGLTRNRISEITDILKNKKYIRKKTVMGKQNRKKSTYTLRKE